MNNNTLNMNHNNQQVQLPEFKQMNASNNNGGVSIVGNGLIGGLG